MSRPTTDTRRAARPTETRATPTPLRDAPTAEVDWRVSDALDVVPLATELPQAHDATSAREGRRQALFAVATGLAAVILGFLPWTLPDLWIEPVMPRAAILFVWALAMIAAGGTGINLLRMARWAHSHLEVGESAPPGQRALWIGGLAGVGLALVSIVTVLL